jgi:hypothetical protein
MQIHPHSFISHFSKKRVPLVAVAFVLLSAIFIHHRPGPEAGTPVVQEEDEERVIEIELPNPVPNWPLFTHPTPQRNWGDVENPLVYMPTGSGRIISAFFGSTRTNSSGRAVFHEGGGKNGQTLERGQVIGIMGHTSTLGIPAQRSHLHLETGLMINPSFSRWYREQRMTPNHGNHHGFNLTGIDPRILLQKLVGVEEVPFSFKNAMEDIPVAWQLLVRSRRLPNFFGRYAPLWKDDSYTAPAMVLDLSENGIILQGRNAMDAELEELGSARHKVLSVDSN